MSQNSVSVSGTAITAPRATGTLSAAARAAVAAGMPDATRHAYLRDIGEFEKWCRNMGRPGLPADGDTLTEYATHLAYTARTVHGRTVGWSPSAIERARWAILKWHSLAEVAPPSTEGLVAVLNGYRAHLAVSKSPKAKPRKATPASRDTLAAMIATLDRDTPAGKRDAAILLLGFAIAGRRGEVAGLDISDITVTERGIQVSVYRQKVRKLDDPAIPYRADERVCPVRATLTWISDLAAHGRTTGPLFVRINRHGQVAPPITRHGEPIGANDGRMSGQAVAQVIQRCARDAGAAGRWSGHSLRRGYATSAHEARVSRRAIERQGGWMADSRAVSGYIEDADRWLYDPLAGVL